MLISRLLLTKPIDLLHSYFGMVSLAFQGEAGLSPVDPTMGSSERTVRHLESLPWWRGSI
jgi:geranylgeranyl transferase type-1 subunit beta